MSRKFDFHEVGVIICTAIAGVGILGMIGYAIASVEDTPPPAQVVIDEQIPEELEVDQGYTDATGDAEYMFYVDGDLSKPHKMVGLVYSPPVLNGKYRMDAKQLILVHLKPLGSEVVVKCWSNHVSCLEPPSRDGGHGGRPCVTAPVERVLMH